MNTYSYYVPAEKQFIVEWPFPLSADDYSQWGHSSAFTALHCRSRIQDRSCCTGERRCKVRRPISWRTILTRFALVAATTVAAPAQKYTTLVSFNGADGANPEFAALVQGRDRDFYGTTRGAGGNVPGTVFKVTAEGTMTTLADLGLDQPYAGLVLATDGWFYGTTAQGGANTWGTIFKMSSKGTLRPLYSFCAQPNCSDGVFPLFGLVQASNGNFYGTTPASAAVGNPGTIFQNYSRRQVNYALHVLRSNRLPGRRRPLWTADPGHQRTSLWDNGSGRSPWLRHGLRNHYSRQADHPAQFQWH